MKKPQGRKGAQKKRMRKNGTAMSDAFESKFEEYLESRLGVAKATV